VNARTKGKVFEIKYFEDLKDSRSILMVLSYISHVFNRLTFAH